jgi:glycosidase
MPNSWYRDTIWWHVFPLGFSGAERSRAEAGDEVQHRLTPYTGWLDHAVSLGVNGLLLGPIFTSGTHGYDTADHDSIDPRLGDVNDFTTLVSRCRERGMRVMLDGVFNHVGREHVIVRNALEHGPESEAGRWIRWVDGYPRCFEGNEPLVELDLSYPPVQKYVTDVMLAWLDRGADGWRLDAAYSPGSAVWAPILAAVRTRRPDTFVLGEVIHGDYAGFVRESTVDTVTQYELWKAIWSSLNDRNLWELDHALTRHAEMLQAFIPATFLGNHDTTRIATKLVDDRHLGHAIALLALLPGIPFIYSGDEEGFTGEKTDGERGDDAVRPPFPASPDDLLPFGAGVRELYQRLFALRRRHPWLVDAAASTRELANEYVEIVLTGADDTIVLALNLADQAHGLPGGELLTSSDSSSGLVSAHGWAVVKA